MKYVIHACTQRMWYVTEFLVPSLEQQGIDDILIKCDEKGIGNLENCMNIFAHITTPGGTWHLQDDIIVCHDFKERTNEPSYDIICGFVSPNDEHLKYEGYVAPKDMWWSFPCIYIPNNLARECANWYYEYAKYKGIYSWMIKNTKYDDYFFREFLMLRYPNYKVLNLKPNLVDHVDYLMGGTTINKEREKKFKTVRAKWFNDKYLVDELEIKIKEQRG